MVLVFITGAMLSKSLIQFSVDGWSCVPSLLLTLGQTMVEVIKINYIEGAFSWKNSISLCPASFHIPRPNMPVTPGVY